MRATHDVLKTIKGIEHGLKPVSSCQTNDERN